MAARQYTVKEVSKKINDPKTFYDSLMLNDFELPSFKSGIVNKNYLEAVRAGTIWVPRTSAVKLRRLVHPPKKELILMAIMDSDFISGNDINLGITLETVQSVNLDWLILVLSTVNYTHRYFHKSYVPTMQEKRKTEHLAPKYVNNDDDFFTDLPDLDYEKLKKKKRTCKIFKPIPVSESEEDAPFDRAREIKAITKAVTEDVKKTLAAKYR